MSLSYQTIYDGKFSLIQRLLWLILETAKDSPLLQHVCGINFCSSWNYRHVRGD